MSVLQEAKHLAWRAGFGFTSDEIAGKMPSRDELLDRLFAFDRSILELPIEAPRRESMMMQSAEERRSLNRSNMRQLRMEWLNMLTFSSGSDLQEKMALFWHGHFACQTLFPGLAQRQLQVLRTYGLGKLRDLLVAISKDPAMLQYLNNQQNRKGHPNENYARELMELFTIGRGHYTEKDVQEAARAFTGWSSNLGGQFVFRRQQHDFGSKVFMGQKGDWNGEDIIDIILEQKATSTYIATRIYRYFVNHTLNHEHIAALADVMRRSDYDIGKVMHYVFTSEWFYDQENVGTRIKSPIELLAGMMRTLEAKPQNKQGLHKLFAGMGQMVFKPPSVAGWPGGRHWINSATLPVRMNLPLVALNVEGTLGGRKADRSLQFDIPQRRIKKHFDDLPLQTLVDRMMNVHLNTGKLPRRIQQLDILDQFRVLMATPEYQMC